MTMVKGQEDEDGAGLYWEDGTRLTDKEGEAWWAGYNQGHQDGEEDAEEDMLGEIMRLREALRRAETILSNMSEENNSMFNRWPVHHEPLRADARNLLPQIRAALGEGKE